METLIGPFAWYVRKSDSKSDLERQVLLLKAWCKEHKIAVPDSNRYADTGSRDLAKKRPDFQRLLKDAKRGLFKTLLVQCLDRFGVEDTDQFFVLRSQLRDAGVTVYSIDPGEGDLSSKDQATIIKIFFKAEASKEEQRKKGARAISGKVKQLTIGKPSFQGGPCPYGFDKQCATADGEVLWTLHYASPGRRIAHMPDGGTRNFVGDKNTHPVKARSDIITLIPSRDAGRIEVVKQAFDLWVNKDVTILGICKRLNALGHLHYGQPWKPTAVRDILNNPVYAGRLVFNRRKTGRFSSIEQGTEVQHDEKTKFKKYTRPEDKWIVIEGAHEGIVDAAVVEASRTKLKGLKGENSRPPRHPDLWLRRFTHCGHCGERLQSRHVGKHAYLFCASSKLARSIGTEPKCQFNMIRHDAVEKIVAEHFKDVFEKLKGADDDVYQRIVKDYHALVHDWWTADRDFLAWLGGEVVFQFPGVDMPDPDQLNAWRLIEQAMSTNKELKAFVTAKVEEWDSKVKKQLEEKERQHKTLTRRWATATDEQLAELTAIRDELEVDITILRRKLSETVVHTLESIIALAQAFKVQLQTFLELAKSDDGLQKSEALKPILSKMLLFFKPKDGPKSKSRLEKWQFEYCDGNEGHATGYTSPRTGRAVRAGSSGCS